MSDPTGAPTLADLVAEIADDLARPDLDAQIRRAIVAAVRRHQTARFGFNEQVFTFQTLPGTDVYGGDDALAIPDLIAIDSAVLVENDEARPLRRIPETAIEEWDDQASASYPCAYSYFGRSLRLWPMPSGEWTIRILAHARLDVPDEDTTESPWFGVARDLISARAKWHLGLHVLRDEKLAATMSAAEADSLRSLRAAANTIASSGAVQAYDL